MDRYSQPPPAVAPTTIEPPRSTGQSVMMWGGSLGGVVLLLSLIGRDLIGILAGVVLIGGSLLYGSRLQEKEEVVRHQRALDLLLHDPMVLINQTNSTRDLDIERLRGMLKKQHIQLTESRAMRDDLVRLSQSLTALQLAAWEKSEKDPSFRALYDQISGAIQTTQAGADELLGDLSGGGELTADAQQRFEAISEMLLTVLDRWINRK
ncbi:MAG: hypothetical protein R2855_05970 [Thermomicrobiales bacterium]